MSTQITLPRDADGREIPLNTKKIYDEDGNERRVVHVEYDPCNHGWGFVVSEDGSSGFGFICAEYAYLEKPAPSDSWEKLFEDLDRCIKGSSLCMYYSPATGGCYDCTAFDDNPDGCDARALMNIKERIRKLRGDD